MVSLNKTLHSSHPKVHARIEYGVREPIWSVKVNDQQDTPCPGWRRQGALPEHFSSYTSDYNNIFDTHTQCTFRRRGPVDASRESNLIIPTPTEVPPVVPSAFHGKGRPGI